MILLYGFVYGLTYRVFPKKLGNKGIERNRGRGYSKAVSKINGPEREELRKQATSKQEE